MHKCLVNKGITQLYPRAKSSISGKRTRACAIIGAHCPVVLPSFLWLSPHKGANVS
jgi:hypothetical protein